MSLAVTVDMPRGNITFPMEVSVDILASHGEGANMPSSDSDVRYQVQTRRDEEGRPNMVIVNRHCSLRKTLDEGVAVLAESVRRQIAQLTTLEYEYDLRALFYAAGDLAGRTLAGVQWDNDVATLEGVAPNATRVGPHSLVLVPQGDNPRVATYMFSLLSRMCGVQRVFIGAEQYQTAVRPQTVVEKRRYLHIIMKYLQADVIGMNAYGEHMFAFYRGCCRYVTIRSHSSEGGWIRDALVKASYPRPRGLISAPTEAVNSFPRFALRATNPQAFASDVISHMLETAAMIADADPLNEHNLTTVCHNMWYDDQGELIDGVEEGANGRPSAYPELKDVLDIVESHCAMMLTRTDVGGACEGHTAMLARNTFRQYLDDDAVDVHLARSDLLPYAFVEHGALLKHPTTVKCDGPKAGRRVELPLLPGGVIVHNRYTKNVSASGRHMAPKVYSPYRDYGLRQMGAFYLGSGPFGGSDFTRMRLIGPGLEEPDVVLCREDRLSMASMHWVRPHCPVPMPGECSLWTGRAMLVFDTHRASQLRTGLDADVVIHVSEPRARCVENLEGGEIHIRRNVNSHYRTVMNVSELSEDEEVQQSLFEQLDDRLPPRLADGRAGFVGLEGAPPTEEEIAVGAGPDIGAPGAPRPRGDDHAAPGADTPEAEEGDGGDVGAEA